MTGFKLTPFDGTKAKPAAAPLAATKAPTGANGFKLPVYHKPVVKLDDLADQVNLATGKTTTNEPKRTHLEQAILFLDAACDGAHSLDTQGFNGRDTGFGKSLAAQLREGRQWSVKQIEAAHKLIQTYKNTQLSWMDMALVERDTVHMISAATERFLKRQAMMDEVYKGKEPQEEPAKPDPVVAKKPFTLQMAQKTTIVEEPKPNGGFRLKPLPSQSTPQAPIGWPKQLVEEKKPDVVTLNKIVEKSIAKETIPQAPQEERPEISLVELEAMEQEPAPQTRAQLLDAIVLDPSQEAALNGLVLNQFGCITGAAGTGKTTVERKLIKMLESSVDYVDIYNYGKVNPEDRAEDPDYGDDEDWKVPAIALCAYTGKAVQQIKKAMPMDYHPRCMTIHKALGFHPIYQPTEYEDPETGKLLQGQKRIFVPLYTADNKMPWEIVVLDEASMIPIYLWNQFIDACKPNTRIYMIGDINQLPPVHGKSVFGFAMLKWPSFELTTIHRQKGENNPIVDNAWRILAGHTPKNVPGKFDMIRLSNDEFETQQTLLKAVLMLTRRGEFDHKDKDNHAGDMIVLPQNIGQLGQVEVNMRLIPYFNPPPSKDSTDLKGRREIIVAGWEKKLFAVGDKVMVTMNDYELGVTNGMTGSIVSLYRNAKFTGKLAGGKASLTPEQVEQLLAGMLDFDLSGEKEESKEAGAEDPRKRASSHIVTVDFGVDEDGNRVQVEFSTTGAVNSLVHAYAATCHKCQGSEFPTVVILCHSRNHRMLYREWLYTAVTRASQRVVLLYNDKGLVSQALNRQKIKGNNLKEKAQSFIEANDAEDASVPNLPEPKELKK